MKNNDQLQQQIADSISSATGLEFNINNTESTSGGCINTTFKVSDGRRTFFIKTNRADGISMFEAESQALDEIARTGTIRVPLPVCSGSNQDHAWLVLENLSLQRHGSDRQLGEQLAAMHKITADQFGWYRDNTIGSTLQINTYADDWVDFFREHRLRYQLSLAEKKGCSSRLRESGMLLLECLNEFFSHCRPAPSLLHGDLWGGNYAFLDSGEPVIYDPALYYGDREADIAMTELFGGFNSEFRFSYEACWPLDNGYETRKQLYNCYHILNHFNLFGGGYAAQAEHMIMRLLSERNG